MADEIVRQWFAAKESILPYDFFDMDLVEEEKRDGKPYCWWCYPCPCGGKDHRACQRFCEDGDSWVPSLVVTCFVTQKQWLIMPVPVADIIKKEEESFLKILKAAPKICRKVFKKMGVSEETFFFLQDTHGIPKEIAEQLALGET